MYVNNAHAKAWSVIGYLHSKTEVNRSDAKCLTLGPRNMVTQWCVQLSLGELNVVLKLEVRSLDFSQS